MMKGRVACAVLFFSMAVANVAFAEQVKNEDANFKFQVPASWERAQRGEVFVATPKDHSLVIMLDAHVNQEMTERAAAFDTGAAAALVGRMLGDAKLVGKASEIKHNKMPCIAWDGEGKNHDGRVVEFVSITCKTGAKKGVTVVGFATKSGLAAHRPALRAFFQGLAPLKA